MIGVIIPTLGNRGIEFKRLLNSLKSQTYQHLFIVVVSQDNHQNIASWINEIDFSASITIQHLRSEAKGLSKARNLGLPSLPSTVNIVTFSDDDCWYPNTAFETVINDLASDKITAATYKIYDPEKNEYYKQYKVQDKALLSRRNILKISSIEFFVKFEALKGHTFNEKFGLGAIYPSGEENIFLNKLKADNTISIQFFDKTIVYHLKPEIQSRLNHKTLIGKGPLFAELSGSKLTGLMLLTAFILKKRKDIPSFSTNLLYSMFKELLVYKLNK